MVAAARESLIAFADNAPIRTKDGTRAFGEVKVQAQADLIAAIAPAAEALLEGRQAPVRRFWFEATKGYAKSWVIAVIVLWLVRFSKRMLRIQIGAADRDQAGEVRLAATEILQAMPWMSRTVSVDKWQIVNSENKSVAEILAADIAGSHGARPDALFIDELTHITKEDFALNLLDNAEKVPYGLVLLSMNAGFVDTWQHRLREAAISQPQRWWFKQVTGPAPYHDPAGIEDARRRNSTSRFNRLFNGVWSAGGDALDGDDIKAATDQSHRRMHGDEPGWAFDAGLDLGIKHDHAAITVLATSGELQRVQLAECLSWSPGNAGKVDLEAVEAAVIELHERFNFRSVLYDPHQMAFMAMRLERHGVPMIEIPFTGKWLDKMASNVLQVFRNRQIRLYQDDDLIRDLGRLAIVEKAYGYKLTSPSDKVNGHADRAIALALATLGGEVEIDTYFEPVNDGLGDSVI